MKKKFLVRDTIFYKKSLKLTNKYFKKPASPNGYIEIQLKNIFLCTSFDFHRTISRIGYKKSLNQISHKSIFAINS